MSARVSVYVHPTDPPVVELSGVDASIPVIRFVGALGSDLTISVGGHEQPAQWLRDTADRLAALADLVDARARRESGGDDA
ncbi:hypothetical protein [Nocardioides sp. R-C-SC26]|uniref:hypothetical protein n=1 Tax=Nocardioides sp. R-C-SC26 TaxID=2870414 RepID=UPI001E33FFA7|nr:hypothetical protein [Nocardioides sp. R-C-SC26]